MNERSHSLGEAADSGRIPSPQAVVEGYVEALTDHDTPRCLQCYAEDATIHFMGGVFRGQEAIAQWHKERFNAGMEILKTRNLKVQGNTVTLDAVVTSKRLKALRIPKLAGKATVSVSDGKITEINLGVRVYNPLAGW